jgi:hypothetical protein
VSPPVTRLGAGTDSQELEFDEPAGQRVDLRREDVSDLVLVDEFFVVAVDPNHVLADQVHHRVEQRAAIVVAVQQGYQVAVER